jgi:protein-S-isoprenylcysteine O-methyltransferase Ste14
VQTQDDKRGPGLKFPPPILPLTLVGCAWAVERWLPMPISGDSRLWLPGLALLLLSVAVALLTLYQFLRAKTHVEPWHPTSSIIQSGVFRYSRNPIYLTFCVATLGCGLMLNSWWGIVATVPLACLLQVLVIRKEEVYLESKFGESYLAYKRRVRRWL